jgi:threonine/homoserine/homoserine lactone efflux protein
MTSALLAGFILGLFAGLAPGPYTTMVAATGLERGFRAALPLALAPMVTDVIPMLATVFLLTSLNPGVVTAMGFLGGIILVGIGIRLLSQYVGKRAKTGPGEEAHAPPTIRFRHVVTSTLFSPAPWFFWLSIASPIMVRHWRVDWRQGAVFALAVYVTNMSSASSLAWAASHGRRVLAPYWRHRVLRFMGIGLILAGGFLIWQAATGSRMQIEPEMIEEFVGGGESGR